MNLLDLPKNVICSEILIYLRAKDLNSFAKVCKYTSYLVSLVKIEYEKRCEDVHQLINFDGRDNYFWGNEEIISNKNLENILFEHKYSVLYYSLHPGERIQLFENLVYWKLKRYYDRMIEHHYCNFHLITHFSY